MTSFPTRRSSDLYPGAAIHFDVRGLCQLPEVQFELGGVAILLVNQQAGTISERFGRNVNGEFPFLAVANFGVPLAFYPLYGWNAVLIAGALRTAALMTATGMVNSVCHKWGSRAKDSRGHEYRADDSRNN